MESGHSRHRDRNKEVPIGYKPPRHLQRIQGEPIPLRIPLRTEAEDKQDLKDARRNKRIQALQRSKRLDRGTIWFSNSVMPLELQPAASVYRVMSKQYPKG